MGVAADLARVEVAGEGARLSELRDRLLAGAPRRDPGGAPDGCPRPRAAAAPRVHRRAGRARPSGVLTELDLRGIAASSGATCTAMTGEPSHVLRAIGCDPRTAEGSLCFTLGRWTTASEIDLVLDARPGRDRPDSGARPRP